VDFDGSWDGIGWGKVLLNENVTLNVHNMFVSRGGVGITAMQLSSRSEWSRPGMGRAFLIFRLVSPVLCPYE
jgi:hypothetical protein